MNDPEYRATESASLAGIGTAEALAKVYSILANGGKNEEGKMLLSEEIIAEIYAGTNTSKDKVLGVPTRFSHGMFFAGEVSAYVFYVHGLYTELRKKLIDFW